MQNTYQDLITDLEGKKPQISGKLEGGKKFKIIDNDNKIFISVFELL